MKYIQIRIPVSETLTKEQESELSPECLKGCRDLLCASLAMDSGISQQIAILDQITVHYVSKEEEDPLSIAIAALEGITCNCCDSMTDAQTALKRILNP